MSGRYHYLLVAALIFSCGCQVYEFVFEPSQARQGVTLRFEVSTPSRADILFVVDNSESMREEQAALASSFTAMLDALAPVDASYRIGLVSTDAHGFQADCCGNLNPIVEAGSSVSNLGAKGNCESCESGIVLNRPHDGARGRLMAAYAPEVMASALEAPDLTELGKQALAQMLPEGPGDVVPYIDRAAITLSACEACGCADCADQPICSQDAIDCISEAGTAAVSALFESNLRGLGVHGFGWEEGLKSALWAVGIDPEEPFDDDALEPGYNLIVSGSPNGAISDDAGGWTRDDAVLAILFVSDEDDCSAPAYLMERRHYYEVSGWPAGSFCYMGEVRERLLEVERMAKLLTASRGGAQSRLVVGVIGGLEATGSSGVEWGAGTASQCLAGDDGQPEFGCRCLEGAAEDDADGWCAVTGGAEEGAPACTALPASRYTEFAGHFRRGLYDSICRRESEGGYVAALEQFSALVTESCFELENIVPAGSDGSSIRVTRLARERVDDPEGGELLSQVAGSGAERGWYYDEVENKICLSLIERRIGDHYEIFVYHEDVVDYRQ